MCINTFKPTHHEIVELDEGWNRGRRPNEYIYEDGMQQAFNSISYDVNDERIAHTQRYDNDFIEANV